MKTSVLALVLCALLATETFAQPESVISLERKDKKVHGKIPCGNTVTWRSADGNPYDVLVLVPKAKPGRCNVTLTPTPAGVMPAPVPPGNKFVPPPKWEYKLYRGVTQLQIQCVAAPPSTYPCEFYIADVMAPGGTLERYMHDPSMSEPKACGISRRYIYPPFGNQHGHRLHAADRPITIIHQGDCPATYNVDDETPSHAIGDDVILTFTPSRTFVLTCEKQAHHSKCKFWVFWHQHPE